MGQGYYARIYKYISLNLDNSRLVSLLFWNVFIGLHLFGTLQPDLYYEGFQKIRGKISYRRNYRWVSSWRFRLLCLQLEVINVHSMHLGTYYPVTILLFPLLLQWKDYNLFERKHINSNRTSVFRFHVRVRKTDTAEQWYNKYKIFMRPKPDPFKFRDCILWISYSNKIVSFTCSRIWMNTYIQSPKACINRAHLTPHFLYHHCHRYEWSPFYQV